MQWKCPCGYENIAWRGACHQCGQQWSGAYVMPRSRSSARNSGAAASQAYYYSQQGSAPCSQASGSPARWHGQPNVKTHSPSRRNTSGQGHGRNQGKGKAAGKTATAVIQEYTPGYHYQPLQKEEDKLKDESMRFAQQQKRNALNLSVKAGQTSGQAVDLLRQEIEQLQIERQSLRPIHIRIQGQEHAVRKSKEKLDQARTRVKESSDMLDQACEEHRKDVAELKELQAETDAQTSAFTIAMTKKGSEESASVDVAVVQTIRQEAERRHKEVLEEQEKRFEMQMQEIIRSMQVQHEEQLEAKLKTQAAMLAQVQEPPKGGEATPRSGAKATGDLKEETDQDVMITSVKINVNHGEKRDGVGVLSQEDEELKKKAKLAEERAQQLSGRGAEAEGHTGRLHGHLPSTRTGRPIRWNLKPQMHTYEQSDTSHLPEWTKAEDLRGCEANLANIEGGEEGDRHWIWFSCKAMPQNEFMRHPMRLLLVSLHSGASLMRCLATRCSNCPILTALLPGKLPVQYTYTLTARKACSAQDGPF
eukprot:TRINITY_DN16608_c0_g3_i1.p1 TRINITY_DN16608_c0_g3~~TRINITY_DN16608_c0_g3_i1.p1  ORF type:complete len:533 (-),score=119.44 TRINITY_DN16608_c0_g3_i1:2815-4413(-)